MIISDYKSKREVRLNLNAVELNKAAIKAIEEIISRKKDAVVYCNKNGVVVAEQNTKIAYRTEPSRV